MIRWLLILLFTCTCWKMHAQVNIITTICGDGNAAYSGDNGQATSAELNTPDGFCLDGKGNMYIADAFNHRIRKVVLATGIITTIAGDGTPALGGDGGQATNAQLFIPETVFTDTAENVYITDAGNNRIRKITKSNGIINTVAGSGPSGINLGNASGDGGPSTDARLNNPSGLYVDKPGNIFIADYSNHRIRKVSATTGIITTIAGNGIAAYFGDGGPATSASLNGPIQVFADIAGNMIICDQTNQRIRKVDASTGIITTVAGSGTMGHTGDDGPATDATLGYPMGIFIDKLDNFYIAEQSNGTIRRIDGVTKVITTVAGTGTLGYFGDGGPATNARMRCSNVWVDEYGTIFIADMDNHRIRMVRDTTLHVGIAEVKRDDIKIHPNPASGELTIEGTEGNDVSVWNMVGQEVYYISQAKKKEVINVAGLPAGIYIVHVVDPSAGLRITKRFVKE
ncbi:MAG: hypothetical protein JWQ38_1253 [Flavipsychrobacter sp.]|nr:hypothetical protein [Flavipsychrobacter sp.]